MLNVYGDMFISFGKDNMTQNMNRDATKTSQDSERNEEQQGDDLTQEGVNEWLMTKNCDFWDQVVDQIINQFENTKDDSNVDEPDDDLEEPDSDIQEGENTD